MDTPLLLAIANIVCYVIGLVAAILLMYLLHPPKKQAILPTYLPHPARENRPLVVVLTAVFIAANAAVWVLGFIILINWESWF